MPGRDQCLGAPREWLSLRQLDKLAGCRAPRRHGCGPRILRDQGMRRRPWPCLGNAARPVRRRAGTEPFITGSRHAMASLLLMQRGVVVTVDGPACRPDGAEHGTIRRIAKTRLRTQEGPAQVRLAQHRVRAHARALPGPPHATRIFGRTCRKCRDRDFSAIECRGNDPWSVSGTRRRPRNGMIAKTARQNLHLAVLPIRHSYWTTSTSIPSLSWK